ncbi:MAG: hypothetical protein KF746_21000 [Chitinophagaceae bacterium]|nr:hypothetical protein [Chitinophagaceae bacterium]
MAQEQNDKVYNCVPYQPLGDWQKEWVKQCCLPPEEENPGGCDCCYDEWTREYKQTVLDLNLKLEEAEQGNIRYKFLSERREMLKSWYEDLAKADELARVICGQFEVLEAQVDKAHENSAYAIDAINYLFCMIKGFYIKVDGVKTILEDLLACIQRLNNPEVNKSGVYKSLQVYNEKLDALIKTRDEMIRLIILAIRISNLVEEELSENFGLQMVFACWKEKLKCKATDEKPDPCADPEGEKKCTEIPKDCKFELPAVSFPISGSVYFKKIKKLYTCHVDLSNTELSNLTILNKEKEELVARSESLKKAIEKTNPEQRCK